MFLSFRVSLTPVTILCRAVLENANAISIQVAGFKHKIYRWLCFCHLWVAYWDGARKSSRLLLLCCVVVKMSVMQVCLQNRYEMGLVCWSPSRRACIVDVLLDGNARKCRIWIWSFYQWQWGEGKDVFVFPLLLILQIIFWSKA